MQNVCLLSVQASAFLYGISNASEKVQTSNYWDRIRAFRTQVRNIKYLQDFRRLLLDEHWYSRRLLW